jgi:transcriptional regulator with PAS, ATPase and Fis domain
MVIVGRSAATLQAKALVERFAPTRIPFLLVGPTGTGKEVFAEYIHQCSGRAGSFVDVNCGALPREMIESLLFGHRRGAFTGASESVEGHVERSNGGTLFLDELSSLPSESQVKLLRVLETGVVQPLGCAAKRQVDLRYVSAVQEGILNEVEARRFRRDLYQRVAGVVIELLPLSARMDDILPLAEHFASLQSQRLEPGAEQALLEYSWPGNVRELRLAIERAGQLVENGLLPALAIADGIALGKPANESRLGVTNRNRSEPRRLPSVSAERLLTACEASSWQIEIAAHTLGVSRASLYRHLRRLGISPRGVSTVSHRVR